MRMKIFNLPDMRPPNRTDLKSLRPEQQ